MSSNAVATVIRMMEELPEATQNQVVEHLREYLEDVLDENQWDNTFRKSHAKLVAAARRAKREIADGKSKLLDADQL